VPRGQSSAPANGNHASDQSAAAAQESVPGAIATGSTQSSTPAKKKTSNLSKNEQNRITARIAEIEKLIPQLEDRSAQLATQMSDPTVAADYARLKQVSDEQNTLDTQLASLFEEWERLAARAEEF